MKARVGRLTNQAKPSSSEAELNDLPKLLVIQLSNIQLAMEGLGTDRAVSIPHPLPQLPRADLRRSYACTLSCTNSQSPQAEKVLRRVALTLSAPSHPATDYPTGASSLPLSARALFALSQSERKPCRPL